LQPRTAHRWLVLASLSLAAACSASGSADLGVSGPFGADASVRRDGAATDTGRRVDTGRAVDTGVAPVRDGGAPMPDGAARGDSGVVAPGKDGGAPSPGCGAREMCGNGLDDDCDGRVDEDCACIPGMTQRCFPGDPALAGRGVCVYGTSTCEGTGEFGTWSACVGAGAPREVECGRGMDFRCNGMVDEGCECAVGSTRACYTGPAGTEARGACRPGMQTCTAVAGGSAWGACAGEITPGARDLCDGVDRDCNGTANDGCTCAIGANRLCYTGPAGTQSVGVCRGGTQPCVRGADGVSTTWGACVNETRPGAEVCANGLDDNCNGAVDEGCPPPMTMACPTGQPRCGSVCCAAGEACAANICVGNGQLRFTLTWDVLADLDLHVEPPCGTEIYYGRLSACGGTLDRDSCPALRATDSADRCNGPENIFWPAAPATGTYLLCVNPWQMNSGTTARWTLNVYRGAMLIRTFTGTRNSSTSYVRCSRTASSFVGEITL
jgi:hypothetical protein